MVAVIGVRFYRMFLTRWTRKCPRAGRSCSELALEAARRGEGIRGVLAVVRGCREASAFFWDKDCYQW